MSISALSPVPLPPVATPNFSDSDDDVTQFSTLDTFSDFLLSIESAKLKIGGDHRCRIYGDIHISGCTYGKAFSVYHRTADEAETVSPGSEVDLTLCGPRYSVYARDPEILYVDLHRVGGGGATPLLQKRVRFDRTLAEPNKPWEMSAIGDDCVLTVHMTAFEPSFITRVAVSPLNFGLDRWLVSGTISAVQTTLDDGEIKRTVPLLRRPDSDPIRHDIPLDRHVVVCPIHIDDDLVQLAYDKTLLEGVEPAFNPSDPVHGKGSSLLIDVDLKVMDAADPDASPVPFRGELEFNLKGSHQVGSSYVGDVVASATKRKVQVKHTSVGDTLKLEQEAKHSISDVSDELAIKVSVTTFLKYSCGDMDDEVHEHELPLYQPKGDIADEDEDV